MSLRWHSKFKVVSYFTPDYAEHAAGLVESLDEHGIKHHVEPISQCKWAEATCMKGEFVRGELARSSTAVVWIDADAVVRKPFKIPATDFAIYGRFTSLLRYTWSPFRTGTVCFAKTERAEALLDQWARECSLQSDGNDQKALFRAWQLCMSDPKCMPGTEWLPLSYCQKNNEKHAGEPIIQHNMASRTLRRNK